MAHWPILARAEAVDAALAALETRPRKAVLLRGPTGIGKTTVAAQIAIGARSRGLVIAPIVALESLRNVPLGAIAPLLASSQFDAGTDTADRYQRLLSQLGDRSDEYLLVVDDAPLLDEVSAAGLYQLVRVLGVRSVLTARDGHTITGPLARLLHEDLVTEIELDALSFQQSAELLRQHFGQAVQPDSLRLLFESSHGNPMFLRELSLAAQRAHAVHEGPHGLEIERAQLPSHVSDGVAERLDLLGAAALELAELVAVSQLWPRQFCDDDALDELIRADLAQVSTEREHAFVRLAHPLYTEAVLNRMKAATTKQRKAQAADRLLALDSAPLRFSGIRLADSATVDQLEWAASYAWAAGDHVAAVALANTACERGGGCAAYLALASAQSALGRLDEADAAFASANASAASDRDVALVVSRWGQHLAFRRHDPAAAAAMSRAARDRLTDSTAKAMFHADLLKWELMAGTAQDAAAATVGSDDALDAPGTFGIAIGMAMMHTMAGRVAEATSAVATGRPIANELADIMPYAGSLLDLNEFLVLVAEGRASDAEAFAAERRLEPFTEAAGLWSYALSLVSQQRGELQRAEELAALAVEQLTWRDFTGLTGAATALYATLLAQRGKTAKATEVLDSMALSLLDDPKVVLQRAEAKAWLAVADGSPEHAAELLIEAGEVGVRLGHAFLAVIAMTAAARFGQAHRVAGAVQEAAAASSSHFMHLAARFAAACAESDAGALDDLAPQLADAGLGACALEGLATAARVHERAGRAEAARRSSIALAARRALVSERTDAPPGDLDLTEREFEVAALAARRVRSRQIADQLGLSTRTVDNHLARVYRKLGITGRDDLEQLMGNGERSSSSS